MEDVLLVHVHVDHLIGVLGVFGQEVLDRIDVVINVVLGAVQIPGHAPHPVVDGDDIGVEAVNQVVQGTQRRNHPAGGYIHIHPEGGNAVIRMGFRIGVHRHMALVQMRHHGIRQRTRGFLIPVGTVRRRLMLSDQHGHTGALGIVILTSHVEHVGTDDLGHIGENLGEPLGIIQLVNILNVLLAMLFRLRIGDIENIETQGFGQVVETMNRNLGIGIFHHSCTP